MPAVRSAKRKASALETKTPEQENRIDVAPRKGLMPRKPASNAKPNAKAVATKKATAAAKSKTATRKAADAKSTVKRDHKEPSPEEPPQPSKKARTSPAPVAAKKEPKVSPILTSVPTERLAIFSFGSGDNGELGLGPEPNAKEVKRPRLNKHLDIDEVGIVAVALGGMHGMVLTHEGKVLTWGVNDMSALGRNTAGAERTREINENGSDDDEIEERMNPLESTPGPVTFPEDVVITRIAAGDCISIAVSETGDVYGWGTFRAADGVLGFSENIRIQDTPIRIAGLKNIVDVQCGNDHVLALDNKGVVFAWGNGQQNQLGRRVVERTRLHALVPRAVGFPRKKIKQIFSGQWHSFAIATDGSVWSWGLNGYAQTGIYREESEGVLSTINVPTRVDALKDFDIAHLAAGQHHSLALTSAGDLLTWGRMDSSQTGIPGDKLPEEDVIRDISGKDRVLITPTKVSSEKFVNAACGTDHSIAIHEDGSAWSWGYNDLFQAGQGRTEGAVEVPTKIENTATRGVVMKAVACGGNFSVLGGLSAPPVNGVNGA